MDDAPRGDTPPTFDGDIANYKDWRRRAELWLYSTRADANKRAPRLLGALVGSAWEACKHLSISELATDGAWDKIFKILDVEYGQPKDVVLIESLEEAIYTTVRRSGDDIMAFITKMEHRFRKLEENCDIKFPSTVKGYILARQYGLNTSELKDILLLTGGDLDYDKVKTSLRRLHYDFSKRSVGKTPTKPVYATTREEPEAAGQGDEDDKDSEISELEEALAVIEEPETIDESEAYEILLNYKEAREKIKAKKLSRGFRPSSSTGSSSSNSRPSDKLHVSGRLDISQLKARTECRSCGKTGHWSRECPNKGKPAPRTPGPALNPVSFVQTSTAPTSSIDPVNFVHDAIADGAQSHRTIPVNFVHDAVPDGAQSASTIETIPRPETPCSDAEFAVYMVASIPSIDESFNPEEPPRYLPKPSPKGPPACVLPPWTSSPLRSPPTRPWTPPLRDYYYRDPWDDPAWFVYRNAPAPLIPSRQVRTAGSQPSDTPKGVLNKNLGVEEICPNGFLSSQSLPVSGGHCLIAGSDAPTLDDSDQTRHIRDTCDAPHNLALQTGQWKLVRPGYAVLDTACSRAIIGADTLDQWSAHLRGLGLTVVHGTGEPAHFRFGNGEVLSSTQVASIPVGLSGVCGFCTVYVIPGGTPFLLSLAMLKALKATIDLGDMSLRVAISPKPIPLVREFGHLILDLCDFGTLKPSHQFSDARLSRDSRIDHPEITVFAVSPVATSAQEPVAASNTVDLHGQGGREGADEQSRCLPHHGGVRIDGWVCTTSSTRRAGTDRGELDRTTTHRPAHGDRGDPLRRGTAGPEPGPGQSTPRSPDAPGRNHQLLGTEPDRYHGPPRPDLRGDHGPGSADSTALPGATLRTSTRTPVPCGLPSAADDAAAYAGDPQPDRSAGADRAHSRRGPDHLGETHGQALPGPPSGPEVRSLGALQRQPLQLRGSSGSHGLRRAPLLPDLRQAQGAHAAHRTGTSRSSTCPPPAHPPGLDTRPGLRPAAPGDDHGVCLADVEEAAPIGTVRGLNHRTRRRLLLNARRIRTTASRHTFFEVFSLDRVGSALSKVVPFET